MVQSGTVELFHSLQIQNSTQCRCATCISQPLLQVAPRVSVALVSWCVWTGLQVSAAAVR